MSNDLATFCLLVNLLNNCGPGNPDTPFRVNPGNFLDKM